MAAYSRSNLGTFVGVDSCINGIGSGESVQSAPTVRINAFVSFGADEPVLGSTEGPPGLDVSDRFCGGEARREAENGDCIA